MAHVSRHISRRLAALMTIVVVALAAAAQDDPALSHFWQEQSYYNPAAAGTNNAIHMVVGGRAQWVDFKDCPQNYFVTVDAPYNKLLGLRLGAGVKAEYERIGLYSNTRIGAQIAWKKRFGKTKTLSVGVQPGVISQTFRGKEVIIPDDDAHSSADEAIPKQDVSGTAFDANVGITFNAPKWWVGASVTHITAPSIELKTGREAIDIYEFNVTRAYYLMGGGNIPINNTLFEVQPSAMFATDLNAWTAQVAAILRYNRAFNIGVGYRYKDAASIFLGMNLKDAYIGYCYDYPVSAISKATWGSHEICLIYNVKLDNREKNKNKQKSIRLM